MGKKPNDSKEPKVTQIAKPEQTLVNDSGTISGSDTRLTREGSRPVRYHVIDKDGGKHGPFEGLLAAGAMAVLTWPGQEQDTDRSGKGWDVEVVR